MRKLSDYNQFWKNHKRLDNVKDNEGREVFEIRWSHWKRILYVLDDDGDKVVIGEFTKKNHRTTQEYLDDILWDA